MRSRSRVTHFKRDGDNEKKKLLTDKKFNKLLHIPNLKLVTAFIK